MSEDDDSKFLRLAIVFLTLFCLFFPNQEDIGFKLMKPKPGYVLIENNSLFPVSTYISPQLKIFGVEINDSLLRCLALQESSGNEKAFNPKDIDGLPKFGLFQFSRDTFYEWCVKKYKLPNDIWDGEVQLECAKRMIYQDNQEHRWPTIRYCK